MRRERKERYEGRSEHERRETRREEKEEHEGMAVELPRRGPSQYGYKSNARMETGREPMKAKTEDFKSAENYKTVQKDDAKKYKGGRYDTDRMVEPEDKVVEEFEKPTFKGSRYS